MQFQIFGDPNLPKEVYDFKFTPIPNFGSKYPKHQDKLCNGLDLRETKKLDALNLEWLISAYNSYPDKNKFFNSFFKKLAGTEKLQQQIETGMSPSEIRTSWKADLEFFNKTRKKYLRY